MSFLKKVSAALLLPSLMVLADSGFINSEIVAVDSAQFQLPLAPMGSYLQQCSYTSLAYHNDSMSIKCGSHNSPTNISLSDLRSCLEAGLGVEWGGGKKLDCENTQYKTGGRMIGNTPVPMGSYIMSCAGVLYDPVERMLYASCRDGDNDKVGDYSYRVSSLAVDECRKGETIAAVDGLLTCRPDDQSAMSKSVPFGGYLNDCLALKTSLTDQNELSALCTVTEKKRVRYRCDAMHKYYHANGKHHYYGKLVTNVESCKDALLNICCADSTLYCSVALPDGVSTTFERSETVPAGLYLQKCNHIFYDEERDMLNANCAVDQAENIFYRLQDQNSWSFSIHDDSYDEEYYCSMKWDDSARFYEKRYQKPSTLMNVSQCVSVNGTSLIDADSEGHLYCPLSNKDKYAPQCGLPTPKPDSDSSEHLALLISVPILSVVSCLSVTVVASVLCYRCCCATSEGYTKI